MKTIETHIVAADHSIYKGHAARVFAPAKMGEVCIYPQHAPLLTLLKPGEICVEIADGEVMSFFVAGGILHVVPDLVMLLADTVLRGEDLDKEKALQSRKAAQDALSAMSEGDRHRVEYQAQVNEALAQLEMIERLRKRSSLGRG